MKLDDILQDFLGEAEERFQSMESALVTLERQPANTGVLENLFRALHSLKGACGFLGFCRLAALAHAGEDLLSSLRQGDVRMTARHAALLLGAVDAMRAVVAAIAATGGEPQTVRDVAEKQLLAALAAAARGAGFDVPLRTARPQTAAAAVRVQSDLFDNLLALSAEMDLARARLADAPVGGVKPAALSHLAQLTQALQAEVLRARLQPVIESWRGLPRLVRDLAAEAGTEVRLEKSGGETLLDRHVLEEIRDPIAHLVRNALAHGIEPPQARLAAGKAAEGTITLSARAAEGQVLITISDDGRGFDIEKISKKALAAGIMKAGEAENMTDERLIALIFTAGFSTAHQVTDMAGRGVGLGAAAEKIERLGGSLTARRGAGGKGAVFTLRVPLTLAMVPAVLLRAGDFRCAVPQSALAGLCRLPQPQKMAAGCPVMEWRRRHVSVLPLPEALGARRLPSCGGAWRYAALIEVDGMTAALAAEEIEAMTDIVVKPLTPFLLSAGVYLGLTLLADGTAAPVLDPRRLMMRHRIAPCVAAPGPDTLPEQKTALLLCHAAERRFAIPLSCVRFVRRLEAATRHRDSRGQPYVVIGTEIFPLRAEAYAAGQGNLAVVLTPAQGGAVFLCDAVAGVIAVPQAQAVAGAHLIGGEVVEVPEMSSPPATDDAGGRVLLVDDSAFFCGLLAPALEQAGYKVDIAADAESALALCAQGQDFDVIISDIEMPGMDGLSFARRVRQAGSAWRRTPLLALSAHATRADEKRGRDAGFDDFITKFDRPALLQKIAALRAGPS